MQSNRGISMNKRLLALAVSGLLLTACGSDNDSDNSNTGNPQGSPAAPGTDLASGQLLFGILVLFGGYGAFLCGQTAVEILQGLQQPPELEKSAGEVVASAVSSAIETAVTTVP